MTSWRGYAGAVIALVTAAVAGCGTSDSMDGAADPTTISVGSQDYYSNEIIAEIYAQALENEGFSVRRDFRIGQREVYLPEIESGIIDVFPEYSGNLLQYYDPATTARTRDDVYGALASALPTGVVALAQSSATDQDSYVVTDAFAQRYDVHSLADLANAPAVTLGGNSELESRPYGPRGLASVYGIDVDFTPIEDGGGPLTLAALLDDDVQLVNMYSADPAIASSGLVTLADPDGLLLASHVVPIVAAALDDDAVAVIDQVSRMLTTEDLIALNTQSIAEQRSPRDIARRWLERHTFGS